MKPPLTLELVWEKDLVFGGRSGDASITLDSAGIAGPSPVQALAFALAGCMSMDLVYILQKARYALSGLGVALSAERAQDNPHRITAVDMRFMVTGEVPDAQVQRAIDLSRDKYCSVWHSLRQDIPLKTSFTVTTTSS
jgi:putative redox protein